MILFIVESVNQSFSISLSINNKFLFSLLECLMAVLYSLVIKAFIKISTNSHIIINAQTLNLHRSHLTLHASSLSNSSFKAFLTHSFTYSLREPRIYKASLPNSSRQQNCNHLLLLTNLIAAHVRYFETTIINFVLAGLSSVLTCQVF